MKREMRNFKLWMPFVAIVCLLVSCADEYEKPEEPDEFVAQANLIMEIKLSTHRHKLVTKIDDEIISDQSYEMEDIANLIYVLHDTDGQFIKANRLIQQHIQAITVDGITTFEDKLPFGDYIITLIVNTEDNLQEQLLRGLTNKYSEAVCQIPNNDVFYKTMEVSCTLPEYINREDLEEDVVFNLEAELHLLTGEFIFLLPAGDKGIPEGANFSMTIEASNLPSAFFLKNGKTLTREEVAKFDLHTYNHTFEITSPFENQLVAKYFLLDNRELENTPEERGFFKFTYKEDAEGEATFHTEQIFPECQMDPTVPLGGHSYILKTDLYHSVEDK